MHKFILAAILCAITFSATTHAAPGSEIMGCETIKLDIHDGGPLQPLGWIVDVKDATGPYLLFFGKEPGHLKWKGCNVGPKPEFQVLLIGDFHQYVATQPYNMKGYWQAVSLYQSSNVVHIQ